MGKSTEAAWRLGIARGWGAMEKQGLLMGMGLVFYGDGHILELESAAGRTAL